MLLRLSREDAESIIRHPDIYPMAADDSSVPREAFELHPHFLPLVVYDPEPVACSTLQQTNAVSCEIHTQTLPGARKRSYEYGRAMLAWIWDNVPVHKLTAVIPEDNRKTLLYTLKLGFKIEGVNENSFMRNGKLMNQTYIGIQRR